MENKDAVPCLTTRWWIEEPRLCCSTVGQCFTWTVCVNTGMVGKMVSGFWQTLVTSPRLPPALPHHDTNPAGLLGPRTSWRRDEDLLPVGWVSLWWGTNIMTQNELIPTIDDGWRASLLSSLFPRSCIEHMSHMCTIMNGACHKLYLLLTHLNKKITGYKGAKQVGRAWNECSWHPKYGADTTTRASHCLSGAAILAVQLVWI